MTLSMRRIFSVIAVAALMAVMMVIMAAPAFAKAYNPNGVDALGQGKASGNCGQNLNKQARNEVGAGGGPKEGFIAPSNCDHFFQNRGTIGNQQ